MRVLGIDVGTSSVKAAVLEIDSGAAIGPIARVGYALDRQDADAATLPTQRLLDAVLSVARQAIATGGAVEGIGFSCMSPALLLLGENDAPLTPILTHLDHRCRDEARRIEAECGKEFLASIGNRPLPGGISVVAYADQVRRDPALKPKIRRYLHVDGWLGLTFTGEAALDYGNASFTGLYNTLSTHDWSPRWLEHFGVDRRWLPKVVSGDETLGGLRPDIAAKIGARAGLSVKLGAPDTSSALLAARLQFGELLHVVGTTQVLAVRTKHPTPAPDHLTRLLGVGDGYLQLAHNPVGGVALDWMHELCFRDQSREQFYAESVQQAIDHPTEVILDPPYLGGDRLQIDARRAAFRELTLGHTRLDLLAAVLQAMRIHHREAVLALGQGDRFSRIVLTGGGAEIAMRVIPDYKQRRVEQIDEASLHGVARLFDPPSKT